MTRAAFLETADRIGRLLCRDAFWHGRRCAWLGWASETIAGETRAVYRAFGPDLYKGSAGIALFLARLWTRTGDPLTRKTFEAAVNQMLARETPIDEPGRWGFFSGMAGMAHALIEIARMIDQPRLAARGLDLLASVGKAPPDAMGTDLIGGAAGVIPALLAASVERPDLVQTAVALGDRLLATAERGPDGWSWQTVTTPTSRNLTGFSHGTAGIAVALLELAAATDAPRFREAARHAFAYERAHYHPKRRNWPDFRLNPGRSEEGPGYPTLWCHGAPGIALSRLRARRLDPEDPGAAPELEAALQTTAASLRRADLLSVDNFSLCHGAAGNADILLEAGRALHRPNLVALAEKTGRQGIRLFARPQKPWPCGTLARRETPGLMLGQAGIGWFYLRLHDAQTPTVLLTPPGAGDP